MFGTKDTARYKALRLTFRGLPAILECPANIRGAGHYPGWVPTFSGRGSGLVVNLTYLSACERQGSAMPKEEGNAPILEKSTKH